MRICSLILVLLLTGCQHHKEKTVFYYKAHSDERAEVLNDCLGEGDNSQNCRNVRQADFELRGVPARDGRAVD